MAEKPAEELAAQWHRRFAADCNNEAWTLAEKDQRTPAEDREMLLLAYASAYHWSKVGTPLHNARADVTLAHAHALLGHGPLALEYAQRCLAYFESNPAEDWDIAFAHAEVAHAAAVLGNAELHARYYAAARASGEAIANEEDRAVFVAEFARIPAQVHGAPAEGR
jgi:hypothetical protein